MAPQPPASAIVLSGYWSKVKRGRVLGPHRNNGLEMVLVTKGRVRWRIENRAIESGPGTVSFTLPWQEHGGAEAALPGNELYYVVFALDRVYARPPQTFRMHWDFGLSPDDRRGVVRALARGRQLVAASDELQWLLRTIVRERAKPGEAHASYVNALGRAALLELVRATRGGPRGQAGDEASMARVRALLVSLETRCGEPWSLERMAAECGLGRTRFAELFERETGDSPSVGLRRVRVRVAQGRLASTDVAITRLALDLGFSSSQHFANVFREFTGRSPSAYRVAARRHGR